LKTEDTQRPQVCQETGLELTSALDRVPHHSELVKSFHRELQECCYALCTTTVHNSKDICQSSSYLPCAEHRQYTDRPSCNTKVKISI